MSAPSSNSGSAPASLDPITFEVVRHKLQAIAEEQAITLVRSGSRTSAKGKRRNPIPHPLESASSAKRGEAKKLV